MALSELNHLLVHRDSARIWANIVDLDEVIGNKHHFARLPHFGQCRFGIKVTVKKRSDWPRNRIVRHGQIDLGKHHIAWLHSEQQ